MSCRRTSPLQSSQIPPEPLSDSSAPIYNSNHGGEVLKDPMDDCVMSPRRCRVQQPKSLSQRSSIDSGPSEERIISRLGSYTDINGLQQVHEELPLMDSGYHLDFQTTTATTQEEDVLMCDNNPSVGVYLGESSVECILNDSSTTSFSSCCEDAIIQSHYLDNITEASTQLNLALTTGRNRRPHIPRNFEENPTSANGSNSIISISYQLCANSINLQMALSFGKSMDLPSGQTTPESQSCQLPSLSSCLTPDQLSLHKLSPQ